MSLKTLYSKNTLNSQKNLKIFLKFQRLIHQTKLPQELKNPQINSKGIC